MIKVNKASAGSGKTYTLVKEYLFMLLGKKTEDGKYVLDEHPHDNHRFILAITFTNKATDEMKQRIVATLDELAHTPDDSPYIKDIVKEFGTTVDKVKACAEEVTRQLLEDYTNFNVFTIDTFFQKLLRTFAFELKLAGDYGVELSDEFVIAHGVDSIKAKLRDTHDKGYTRLNSWLWSYIKDLMRNDKSWNIFSDPTGPGSSDSSLYSFAKALSKEIIKTNGEKLFEFIDTPNALENYQKALRDGIVDHSKKAKSLALEICSMLNANGVKANGNTLKRYDKLANDAVPIKADKYTTTIYDGPMEGIKWVNAKSAEVNEDRLIELAEKVAECFRMIFSYTNLLSLSYQLGLLGDIRSGVQKFTTDNNTILLSGSNDLVKRIIDGCETPFIYERVGMYLHNFLIDEFQDTSRMQWENLRRLVQEGVAKGYDSLIIGDVKQSIYRFRNSDPQLLHSQIKEDFKGYIQENEGRSTNWRSARNIVEWNNAFFKKLASLLGMSDYYEDVEQEVCPRNQKIDGHVIISQVPPDKESADSDDEDSSAADVRNQWIDDRMIDDILSLFDHGYQQRDIAILVDKNAQGQRAIARILKWNKDNPQRSIKVVSEESLLLSHSPAVRIVVSILDMFDHHDDASEDDEEKKRNAVLPMVMRRFELNRIEGKPSAEAFEEAMAHKNDEWDEEIKNLHSQIKVSNLDGLVGQIIKSQLSEQMIIDNAPFLHAFRDAVCDCMERYGSSIHRFMAWWNKVGVKMSISSPANVDAVQVMTIHKSKGLQFPCVIIPNFDWDMDKMCTEWISTDSFSKEMPKVDLLPPVVAVKRNSKPSIFEGEFNKIAEDNIMDTLNKTYVACTRAQYELILYTRGATKTDEKGKEKKFGKELAKKLVPEFLAEASKMGVESNTSLDDVIYELGAPTCRKDIPELNKVKSKDESESDLKMPPYRIISDDSRLQLESPEIILEIRDTPRYQGTLLHKVMEKIRTVDDVELALRRAWAKGMMTRDEYDKYNKLLAERLADTRVAEWFAKDNRLMVERPISTAAHTEKRPDRIVIRPNGKIMIIDYKFAERTEIDDKKYSRQVRGYIDAFCRASGTPKDLVSGYVWYIQPECPESEILSV